MVAADDGGGREGIGIEFGDGCDVFWLLPGEVTSTIPVPPDGLEDVTGAMARFEQVERVRERALHVVRHYLASNKFHIDRNPSGQWDVGCDNCSTVISVGASLTARAVEGADVYALVASVFKESPVCHVPTRRRVERYLATDGPPADERTAPPDEGSATEAAASGLRGVLAWCGLCRALDNDANLESPEALERAARSTGRIGEALLRLADRLPPGVEAHFEVTDNAIALDFADGEASFRVATRSQALARQVRSQGPGAAGDGLAEEYFRLDAGRTAVLRAVRFAAADRRWALERVRALFAPACWYLGSTRREVTLQVGDELTEALRAKDPTGAVRTLLASQPAFAEECVRALGRAGEAPRLPERGLAPAVPSDPPALRELDPTAIAEMDRFASDTLAVYIADERTMWDYGKPEVFDPARDEWAAMADWVRLAERHIEGERAHPLAIRILLDAGDARGADLARQYLRRAEPHHEVSDAEVELAWRFRHEVPDVARAWFAPEPFDPIPFAEARARLGDPVAIRYLARQTGFVLTDDATWTPALNPRTLRAEVAPEARRTMRDRLLGWARTTWRWSPVSTDELWHALWAGLGEVAEALAENPYLLQGLLRGERRNEMMDEPGLLLGSDLLRVWSALAPTAFMARLIVTARSADLVGEAQRVSSEAVARNPRVAGSLDAAISVYRRSMADLEVTMAIAWRRYRASR